MKKYVLIAIGIVGILAVGGFVVSRDSSVVEAPTTQETLSSEDVFTGVEHTIELTPDGYNPSEITIAQGDAIVFSAREDYGKLHWPASNLHPTHLVYSEFDPLKPVEPEQTWRFVFTKVGEWRFHDHLAPYFTGTITVE